MVWFLLPMRDVIKRTGLSRSSIYAGIKAGTFPPAIALTPRRVAWDSRSIDAWMESRITAAYADRGEKTYGILCRRDGGAS